MSVNHSNNTQIVCNRILDDLKTSSTDKSLKDIVTDALTSTSSISLIAILSEIKATLNPQSNESIKVEIATEFLLSEIYNETSSSEEPSFQELIEVYSKIKSRALTLNKSKKLGDIVYSLATKHSKENYKEHTDDEQLIQQIDLIKNHRIPRQIENYVMIEIGNRKELYFYLDNGLKSISLFDNHQ